MYLSGLKLWYAPMGNCEFTNCGTAILLYRLFPQQVLLQKGCLLFGRTSIARPGCLFSIVVGGRTETLKVRSLVAPRGPKNSVRLYGKRHEELSFFFDVTGGVKRGL